MHFAFSAYCKSVSYGYVRSLFAVLSNFVRLAVMVFCLLTPVELLHGPKEAYAPGVHFSFRRTSLQIAHVLPSESSG